MIHGYTPKQFADDFILQSIRNEYNTSKPYDWSETDWIGYRRRLAKMHNWILEKSGLDGVELEVPSKRQVKSSKV